jgi:hypothetical protein
MENMELRGFLLLEREPSRVRSWEVRGNAQPYVESALDTALLLPLLKLPQTGGSCPPGGIKPGTFDSWDNPCVSATTVLFHSCFSIASRRLQVDIAGSPGPQQGRR